VIKIQVIKKTNIKKLSYKVFNGDALIAVGNEYKTMDNLLKALRAVRDNIKNDKRVRISDTGWLIKSANGQTVLESVTMKDGQAEAELTALRYYMADVASIQYTGGDGVAHILR